MKAKIFNTGLATLILTLGLSSFCLAKATGYTLHGAKVLDPLGDVSVQFVKSPCGNFMQLDAKTKHLHLKAKDIELLAGPSVSDNAMVTTAANCNFINTEQISQDQNDQANTDNDADQQVKNYSKSYSADAYSRLGIDNRYGKVSVKTWNKNEFKVDVQIKVSANKTGDTNDLLNSISISDKRQGQVVSFKTNIDNESAASLLTNKNKFRKVEINYVVYMPAKNALSITNKWGDVELPDLSGKLVINCSFGNLVAQALTNPANEIKINYGDARIASLRASDLDIISGTLTLGWADKLNADMSYSSAKIGKISTSGVINAKYGSGIQISNIDKNLKNLLVNSDYSAVKVGLGNTDNADIDVKVHYGSFNPGNHNINISKSIAPEDKEWNPTQNFKGHLGKGNGEKIISINSNYSSVRFD